MRSVGADYYSVPWTSVWVIVIDPMDSQTLYAADHQSGDYLSTDGGANWIPVNEGLSTKTITAMEISSDGKVLYAATEGEGGLLHWVHHTYCFFGEPTAGVYAYLTHSQVLLARHDP